MLQNSIVLQVTQMHSDSSAAEGVVYIL